MARGGFVSRKLWFSIGTAVAIIACGIFCGFVPAAIPVYPELVGGLLAVLFVYTGGNVANKWTIGKIQMGESKEPRHRREHTGDGPGASAQDI